MHSSKAPQSLEVRKMKITPSHQGDKEGMASAVEEEVRDCVLKLIGFKNSVMQCAYRSGED